MTGKEERHNDTAKQPLCSVELSNWILHSSEQVNYMQFIWNWKGDFVVNPVQQSDQWNSVYFQKICTMITNTLNLSLKIVLPCYCIQIPDTGLIYIKFPFFQCLQSSMCVIGSNVTTSCAILLKQSLAGPEAAALPGAAPSTAPEQNHKVKMLMGFTVSLLSPWASPLSIATRNWRVPVHHHYGWDLDIAAINLLESIRYSLITHWPANKKSMKKNDQKVLKAFRWWWFSSTETSQSEQQWVFLSRIFHRNCQR